MLRWRLVPILSNIYYKKKLIQIIHNFLKFPLETWRNFEKFAILEFYKFLKKRNLKVPSFFLTWVRELPPLFIIDKTTILVCYTPFCVQWKYLFVNASDSCVLKKLFVCVMRHDMINSDLRTVILTWWLVQSINNIISIYIPCI